MPIVFDHTKLGKRYIIRQCSNRLTVVNAKNYQVMQEIDFKDYDTALFFAGKFTTAYRSTPSLSN